MAQWFHFEEFWEVSVLVVKKLPEVGGRSVRQISKKYFAGVIYGQKSLMC
jgi:hypothetical protein